MGDLTISAVMQRLNETETEAGRLPGCSSRRNAVPQGLRSTFWVWMSEKTAYPSDIAEFALTLDSRTNVEQAYRRSNMIEKRRQMMEDRAACLLKPGKSDWLFSLRPDMKLRPTAFFRRVERHRTAGRGHPLVCGEQTVPNVMRKNARGSSPRVRGTAIGAQDRPHRRRFIPAFAGNSRRLRCQFAPPPVHPRVCGEQSSCRHLIYRDILNVKERTDKSPLNDRFSLSHHFGRFGKKLTSFKPSKSTGVRRFFPAVRKSYPWSVGAFQTITASPISSPATTCSQIISRVRIEYSPT